jgi:DNA polymerase III gamma/tau subunit
VAEQISQGLYQRHRPKSLKGIVGQPGAVAQIQALLDKGFPHAILLYGMTGVGKTTLARILKGKLGCHDSDFHEMNIGDLRGIDNIRDIKSTMMLAPMGGSCRIWVFDEMQAMLAASQQALLKILEDAPGHVYFFLCTTDPDKLIPTVRGRCTHIKLGAVPESDLVELVQRVAEKEETTLPVSVAERIADCAGGSARNALGILEGVLWLPGGEEAQLEAVQKSSHRQQGDDLGRLLMDPRTTWPQIASILKDLEDGEETMRHRILGYANSIMVGGRSKPQSLERAYKIICAMRFDFYASKKAGLTAACWEVICG